MKSKDFDLGTENGYRLAAKDLRSRSKMFAELIKEAAGSPRGQFSDSTIGEWNALRANLMCEASDFDRYADVYAKFASDSNQEKA